ncbi:unnamed protein product, partial [Fusarium fujikuroi]
GLGYHYQGVNSSETRAGPFRGWFFEPRVANEGLGNYLSFGLCMVLGNAMTTSPFLFWGFRLFLFKVEAIHGKVEGHHRQKSVLINQNPNQHPCLGNVAFVIISTVGLRFCTFSS